MKIPWNLFHGLSSSLPPIWATIVAGVFVLASLSLSGFLIFEHLSAYRNPEEQKFLIGVILMAPCYAIESYISLANPSVSVDCEILRDCYEAFAMYCFGRYLIACLGGEERTIQFMRRQGGSRIIKHPFPMNYILKPWKLGEWFFSSSTILAVVLEAFGVYCEGEFKWTCGYPYMAVVLNFSQSWALYCLVQFYAATKDELAHIKPLAKFLMVAIAILYSLGLFNSPIAQGLQFKSSVQDFIICIEMGIASAVHLYVFPALPYALMGDRVTGAVSVLGDYVSVECPVDPDEVRDSERPTKLRLPRPTPTDVKFTVNHAVEPMEKGFSRFNEKLHKISQNMKKHKERRRAKDDACISSPSPARRVIRGIDDPLLNGGGSVSDSGAAGRGRRHRRRSGYASAESGGESSDQGSGGSYEIRGRRWITRE
ncbi:unnamed protein product [Spirodela intermedia]|uniref:Uncharacterized protein n=1 Tax=Spirodela intermedia TaxID=51605 RepID=A0A7I8IEQ4_SPIIN|nr:unnamed protein product [Spirodela intermedia]CAA6655874.1 unnamed protein product [Spirodela intermedia]